MQTVRTTFSPVAMIRISLVGFTAFLLNGVTIIFIFAVIFMHNANIANTHSFDVRSITRTCAICV
jgi:hypothetical protein